MNPAVCNQEAIDGSDGHPYRDPNHEGDPPWHAPVGHEAGGNQPTDRHVCPNRQIELTGYQRRYEAYRNNDQNCLIGEYRAEVAGRRKYVGAKD